jgi:hypothetical protein
MIGRARELFSMVDKCKSCKAPIVWMKTKTGKNIPVNVESITTDECLFNPVTMVAHFSNCPYAQNFRKKKP